MYMGRKTLDSVS